MIERIRSADGTAIAFERTGDGPALAIVGGALNDRTSGAGWASMLADRFTVVTYDRRGRGDSGDTPPYAVEREIEDLAAVVDAIGPASVFGHSSGGALALDAAASGVPFERLAVYEPPFIVDGSRPPLPDDYVGRLEELAASGRRDEAVAYFMTVGVGVPPDIVDGMRHAPAWPRLAALAHTLHRDGRMMGDDMAGRPLRPERFARVAVPVLVLVGGASAPWIRAAGRALADVLADAEHRVLEGQTHDVDAAALAPVLEAFLTR